MAYIYENTNTIAFQFRNLATGMVSPSSPFTLDGRSFYNPKSETKLIENINSELFPDSDGMRMEIKVDIMNRNNINSPYTVNAIFAMLNAVHRGISRAIIYPSYDSTKDIDSLDSFECVMKDYYKIKKLHNFLKSGQQFTLTFIEYLPEQMFVPKIPTTSSTGNVAVPMLPGGNMA